MNHLPGDSIERIYAGLLGKTIGVRHGSNVEGWSAEKISSAYGEVTGYLFDFRNFAADDDTNGPLFLIRALEDYPFSGELNPLAVAHTLCNYAPYEHGFFWWGGYGNSTESTAYHNLKSGILPPRSGSVEQNGAMVAEQIGGQIFIDCWGLVAPGDPARAAAYARAAACVMHGGNGVYGGMFMAACIAAAFVERDIARVISAGLGVIPTDCTYARMVKDLVEFHRRTPGDWKACFAHVRKEYWMDRYPGGCHIIPNSAIMVLSLLYGKGEFSATINICLMGGFDTDCNVGNVGTIVGVLNGLEGIDFNAWRKPINDLMICSSVVGSLNATDLPRCAFLIGRLAYKAAGQEPPAEWRRSLDGRATAFDFELPGSTHAFRVAVEGVGPLNVALRNSTELAHTGKRSLKVAVSPLTGGTELRIFHQTYYRPVDFNDSRYDPSFSPLIYPGQTLKGSILISPDTDCSLQGCLYVKDVNTGKSFESAKADLVPGKWQEMLLDIPSGEAICIEEAGFKLIPRNGWARSTLIAYVDDVSFSGQPDYRIDFSRERIEFWNNLHREVSQFTYLKGIWTLEDGELSGSTCDLGEAYTGGHDWTDYRFAATLLPRLGENHNLNFRVQGAMRSYAVGLAPNGMLALYKNDNGYRVLTAVPYPWENGKRCSLEIEAVGPLMRVRDDNRLLFEHRDEKSPYLRGQVGMSVMQGSHCHYSDMRVQPAAQA